MKSPITNQINTVFVHVRDLKRSVKWYTELLHHPADLAEVSDPVYNMPMNHMTGLTIDAGSPGVLKEVTPASHSLFNLHTDDIDESYAYVKELGMQIESDIIRFDDFSFFHISDPDGNIIMICTG